MKEKEFRRSLAIFPIGSVMRLTDLSARQIRYYEEQGLVSPERTEGNRRLYSLNDMDKLLDIKELLSEGLNMAAIKQEYAKRDRYQERQTELSSADVRRFLHDEFITQSGFATPSSHFDQRGR